MAGGGSDPGAADAARAATLRALAGRIETVMDGSLKAAQTPEWVCPNAEDVRGRLGAYQAKARSIAEQLRAEAAGADNAARRLRDAAPAPEGSAWR